MINVAELITDPDFAAPYTVRRVTNTISATGLSAGELVPVLSDTLTPTMVVQPNAKPEALLVLPEGLRNNRAIHIFSPIRLYFGGDDAGTDDITDYVQFDGAIWKVFNGKNWLNHGYYEAWAVESSRAALPVFP